MPDIRLRVDGHRSAAKHEVDFDITSQVILETKPGVPRPFTMRATRLHLSWSWHASGWRAGEWHLFWCFYGRRYRKTTGDWSPHEQGFMTGREIDLPGWVQPLIEANTPEAPPVVLVADEPKCRLCGCTETKPCESGCRRVDDPQKLGELCSSHLVEAQHLKAGQVVRHPGWHGGHRVRIDRVFAWEAGQVSVFFQDTTAYYPLVEVHVAAELPVLLAGGAR